MTLTVIALICAGLTATLILFVYLIYMLRRKSGKSDIRDARISLVISSFIFPVLVTTLFALSGMVAQRFYHYRIPVGQHGEGVFLILLSCVAAAVFSLILLLPKIKHQWLD